MDGKGQSRSMKAFDQMLTFSILRLCSSDIDSKINGFSSPFHKDSAKAIFFPMIYRKLKF